MERRDGGGLAERVQHVVDEGLDLDAGFEPGARGKTLPEDEGRVGGQDHGDGGHANFGALGNVVSQRHQPRQNLLGVAVHDAVEGQDGPGPLSGIVPLASSLDVRFQDGQDLFDSEGSDSGQSGQVVSGGGGLGRLEFLAQHGQEVVDEDGVLGVAEVTQVLDGEALLLVEGRLASSAQQVSHGQQGGLLQHLGALDGAGLDHVLSNQIHWSSLWFRHKNRRQLTISSCSSSRVGVLA